MTTLPLETDIAIIGMAGAFPEAATIDDYWTNILHKRESVITFSQEELIAAGISSDMLENPQYVKAKGYLANADMFDADFFKFSQHEAEILDPQYRIFFEVVWRALENAAYLPQHYSGKMALFSGSSNIDSYYRQNLINNTNSILLTDNFNIMLYNAKDFLSSLIAYKLNLRGPAITIQTACSTSLVAVSMACQSLLNEESDIAIAGGTSISMPFKSGYLFQNGMMLSPTGQCRTFDQKANGIVLGNGAGAVVLKRLTHALADGDHIHAVIKGFAINNDGAARIGFTAPSVAGQQAVIMAALKKANLQAQDISYVETHGTATILGDLIEVEALRNVFLDVSHPIALGSVKPNIGHLDAASGIAGLIKTIMALKHKTLPPNINFETLSPQLNFANTPFYVNTDNKTWETWGTPRYAGVSSFGMGGTNAHVILAEAPEHKTNKSPTLAYSFNKKSYCIMQETLKLPTFKSVNLEHREGKRYQEIEVIIKEVFERFLFRQDIDIHIRFSDLGGDSLSALLITHEINKILDVKLPFSLDQNNLSVQSLSEHIVNHIENR